jgi:hypothetical protein
VSKIDNYSNKDLFRHVCEKAIVDISLIVIGHRVAQVTSIALPQGICLAYRGNLPAVMNGAPKKGFVNILSSFFILETAAFPRLKRTRKAQ